jgi:hypothetical protein
MAFTTSICIALTAALLGGIGLDAQTEANAPRTEDATRSILAAFDRYQLVGMGAAHGYKDLDDFTLSLIRNSGFPDKVNDIVVECGNRKYQDILDRFIAGADVSAAEIRPVWGSTTQQMCSLSGFYERLFPLVRQLNQKLPPQKRLRVLAADPPIDWSTVTDKATWRYFNDQRKSSITSVIMNDVLAKHHKALLLFGQSHLTHQGHSSSVADCEKAYPGAAFVIFTHRGFGNFNPLDVQNDNLEERMTSWPTASLVSIKGTWLGDLDLLYYVEIRLQSDSDTEITDLADAYLYLGPRRSLIEEAIPDDILDDHAYIDELNKRPWNFRQIDTTQKGTANKPLYVPIQGRFITDARLPLAKFVGTYTGSSATTVEIDIHKSTLVARFTAFPNGVPLVGVGDNLFRVATSSDVTLEFDARDTTVRGLTLKEQDSSGHTKITALRWNP